MGTDAVIVVCAVDGAGNEIWTSDGTAGSLVRAFDLAPGAASSNPDLVAVHGGKIFFTAFVSGKLEMYAADLVTVTPDAGADVVVPDSGTSGGSSSGASGASSGGTSSSGGTVIDDPSADGTPVTNEGESGCSIAGAGMRKRRLH